MRISVALPLLGILLASFSGAWAYAPEDCVNCHREGSTESSKHVSVDAFRASVHGAGVTCADCHSGVKDDAHMSAPGAGKVDCAGCHPAEAGKTGYLAWLPSTRVSFHGKQDLGMAYDSGNCIGCHQGDAAHGEKGRVDAQTCNTCHVTKGGEQMWGSIHPAANWTGSPSMISAAVLYQVLLVVLVIGVIRLFFARLSGENRGGKR